MPPYSAGRTASPEQLERMTDNQNQNTGVLKRFKILMRDGKDDGWSKAIAKECEVNSRIKIYAYPQIYEKDDKRTKLKIVN